MNNLTHNGFGGASPARMSSKEIASLCEKDHKHVIRDIRTMLDALGDGPDLGHVEERKDSRGYTLEFFLPRDLTLTLVSGYNVQLRHRIVTRLQQIEDGASVNPTSLSRMDLIRLAFEAETEAQTEKALRLEYQHQVEQAAPKTDFYDRFANADGLYGLQNAARVLGEPPNKFIRYLKQDHLFYQGGALVPRRPFIERGLFEVKSEIVDDKPRSRTWMTPKGVQFFAKKLGIAEGGNEQRH